MEQMHVMDLLIGLDVGAQTPTPTAADIILDYTQLLDGELAVVNEFNEVQSAASVLTDPYIEQRGIRIVGRKGTELMFSDFIHVDDLISYTGIADSDGATQQVTHIGYVGSGALSLDVINDNVYKVHINIKEKDRTGFGRNEIIDVFYRSSAAATQTDVAFGILENLRASLNTKPELLILAELLNSAAVVAGNGFDNNATVINGSKYITVGTNLNYGGVALAVGDLVRMGTVGAGTALTDSVYRVVTLVSATVFEIDRPVAEASGVYAAATADLEVIPAASIANYGIQLTGQALTHIPGKRPYSIVMFDVGLDGFTNTTVTYSTAPVYGIGLPDQIKDLEYFVHGNRGDRYRADYMHRGYTSQVADAGENYDQLNITWNPDGRSEGIDGPRHNPKQLVIALVTGYSNTEAPDILVEILDAYFGIASGLAI